MNKRTNDNPNTSSEPSTSPSQLGLLIHEARVAAGLHFSDLEEVTGIPRATLHGIEKGRVAHPKPTILPKLASALNISLADVYVVAGYEVPKSLPTFAPYLRSRYKDMPPEARDELAEAFARITEKYGFDERISGPKPGEDE